MKYPSHLCDLEHNYFHWQEFISHIVSLVIYNFYWLNPISDRQDANQPTPMWLTGGWWPLVRCELMSYGFWPFPGCTLSPDSKLSTLQPRRFTQQGASALPAVSIPYQNILFLNGSTQLSTNAHSQTLRAFCFFHGMKQFLRWEEWWPLSSLAPPFLDGRSHRCNPLSPDHTSTCLPLSESSENSGVMGWIVSSSKYG